MHTQIVIKVLLVVGLLALIYMLVNKRPGARPRALRSIAYLLIIVMAIIAVIFPQCLTWIAGLVGVGRGADLLLYALVLMFFNHLIGARSHNAKQAQRFTDLARHVAIREAEPAKEAGRRLAE